MSDDFSVVERVVEEVSIDLVTERIKSISAGIQASSTRTEQASPSNARGDGPSWPSAEKRTKHKDNLAN